MGAVADLYALGDWRRLRMWALAIAVAITGSAALQGAGLIDLTKSIYLGGNVPWVSHLAGGFLFGIGMVLGSGCGAKSLIRAGTGNLKSLVVLLVFALSAYMTLRGLFGVWRVNALDIWRWPVGPRSDLPGVIALATGNAWPALISALPYLAALALAAWAFAARDFRQDGEKLFGGIVVGLLVVGGWYVSGNLGHAAEDPETLQEAFYATNSGRMESLSFSAPLAYSLELLLLWSDSSRTLTFGVATVAGMLLGAMAMALATRQFRWEGFATREDLAQHLAGGLLMGFGGVTALGCTIGQGLSGISTLALGSILTLGAIIAGALAGLAYLAWRAEVME
jgi:uncharacterized membrane protein YedE/YeeE